MTSADRLRQAVTVLLVAALFVLSPALASARFTDTADVVTVAVGTDTLIGVTGVTGTYSCRNQGGSHGEKLEVSVTNVTVDDQGLDPASYRYTIYLGDRTQTPASSVISTASAVELTSGDHADDNVATTWTVEVSSVLGSWTGSAWTRTIACPQKGNVNKQSL